MYELKPDYERSKQRIDAFWERELLDRPVVQFGLAKPPEECVPLPASHHADPAARWLDTQYQTEFKAASLANREYLGEDTPTGGKGRLWMAGMVVSTLVIVVFLAWYTVTKGPGFLDQFKG